MGGFQSRLPFGVLFYKGAAIYRGPEMGPIPCTSGSLKPEPLEHQCLRAQVEGLRGKPWLIVPLAQSLGFGALGFKFKALDQHETHYQL